jgi:hypothetical protein
LPQTKNTSKRTDLGTVTSGALDAACPIFLSCLYYGFDVVCAMTAEGVLAIFLSIEIAVRALSLLFSGIPMATQWREDTPTTCALLAARRCYRFETFPPWPSTRRMGWVSHVSDPTTNTRLTLLETHLVHFYSLFHVCITGNGLYDISVRGTLFGLRDSSQNRILLEWFSPPIQARASHGTGNESIRISTVGGHDW